MKWFHKKSLFFTNDAFPKEGIFFSSATSFKKDFGTKLSQPDCALICWKQETIELELETLIKLFLRNSTGNHHRPANWTKEDKNHHLLLDAAEDCEKIKEPLIFINILQYLVSSTYILLETISILQNLIFLWVELVKVQRRTLKFKPFIVQWVLQRFFS